VQSVKKHSFFIQLFLHFPRPKRQTESQSKYQTQRVDNQPQMLNKELLKNWEKIDGLPDDDKLAVKKIVAALLVKHSVELAVR